MMRSPLSVTGVLAVLVSACGGGDSDGSAADALAANGIGVEAAPFQELYDQGVDRYLGAFTPMLSEPGADGIVEHRFGVGGGPQCYLGDEFSMSTRDGSTDALLIFLQGGGACGPDACNALSVGLPFLDIGLLSASDALNPAAEYNVGYVPYCDGSFHSGDRDVDSDGDGVNDRFFRGIQNLSASLDVIANTYPAPGRILLAGNSAGAWGVHFALPLVRSLYPDVAIDLVNDSGVGISRPGLQQSLTEYWNASAFYPSSCSTCIGEDGHITDYHKYQLAQDDNLRMGFISSTADQVVVASLGIGASAFEAAVVEAMAEVEAEYPQRARSLLTSGDEHTFILTRFDVSIGDTTVRQWVRDMLERNATWQSMRD
ncbi:MAG: pectin acetylesterase-family hydrolase [Pseudomonadota bacterium]